MARYLGDDVTIAVKLPCAAPANDDVFTVDPTNPKVGIWKKAGTANVADLAITNAKIKGPVAAIKLGTTLENGLRDGGFDSFFGFVSALDDTDAWDIRLATGGATLTRTTTGQLSGRCAVEFVLPAGSTHEIWSGDFFEVIGSETLEVTIVGKASATAGTTVRAYHFIDWYDASQTIISRSTELISAGKDGTRYETTSGTAMAPSTARYGRSVVQGANGSGTAYTLTVDSVRVQRAQRSVPIGSIVAWTNHLTGTPLLPSEWVECNGQVLNDPASPLHGVTIPDLNTSTGSDGYFLRGTKAATTPSTGQAQTVPNHTHPASGLGFSGDAQTHYHQVGISGTSGDVYSAVAANTRTPSFVNGRTSSQTLTPTGSITGNTSNPTGGVTENRPKAWPVRWIIRIK